MHWYAFQTPTRGERIGIPLAMSKLKRRGLIFAVLSMALFAFLLISNWQKLFEPLQDGEERVVTAFPPVGRMAVLLEIVTVLAIVVARLTSTQRRKALEQIIEMYFQSGQALVRYVMLNRQCSEEAAYQRIAAFVKKHVPLEEHSSIDRMFAHDRQSLLDKAISILVHDPGEIDKI